MSRTCLPAVVVLFLSSPAGTAPKGPAPAPPVAARRPYTVKAEHGARVDPYYWLRDDTRKRPDVLAHLEAENAYYASMTAPYQGLVTRLEKELVGRLKQDESSVPYKDKDYLYYTRFETGKEYPVFARRAVGSDAEQVLVDGNKEAEGKAFYQVRGRAVSPRQDTLAFLEDTVGRRQFTLRFREIATGRDVGERISGLSPFAVWANDNKTVYYVENDPVTLLSTRVKKHTLGTDPKADPLVYEEKDTTFYLRIKKTIDERFVTIVLSSTVSGEVRAIDADHPDAPIRVLAPRERDLLYSADHLGGRWIIRTNLGAPNYRLMAAADDAIGDKARWKDVLPYDPATFIEDFALFRDYLALNERQGGLLRLRVVPWGAPAKAFVVFADEPAYAERLSDNFEPGSDKLRYTYTSLTTPPTVYDVDMRTGMRTLLKRETVLGGFDPANYATERLWATARDGTKVPVSIAYRKGLPRDGSAPLYQTAYGSYGSSSDPEFEITALSLLDRGFVYAIAHVRGGQEMGRAWYDDGHLLRKKNTFTDFIDVTDFLVREKYAAKDKVCAMGVSAGGLLMGAVANLAPEKYRAIVAHVPFVDAVTTMLDETIPLTSNEWDEWGDPRKKTDYDYILSYSPYDNVAAKAYPALYVTTSLDDSQVQYYEPAKWVAKLRATKTDKNPLLFKINMAGGHGGKSGRFASLGETAEEYAFLLNLLGRGEAALLRSPGAAVEFPFQDPDRPAEDRITDLIGRMTVEEKIDALALRAAVPRLGVKGSPHIEGYHGVAQGGPSNWGRRNPTPTTQFPQAYGLGSTWDPALVRKVAAQEAQEARYLYQSAKYARSGLIVRAPNADLARDPRWGRTEEVYGEDPFHVGVLATAFTRGLQGDDPRYWKTAALLKHFLANSNEDGRTKSSSDFDERLWREYYAKPFEMAVREGGSRAMMAAYNAVNHTPAHVHPMLRDIVMKEWGLDGILCTDGGGLRLLVSDHKAFPDLPAAAAACIKAGLNHFLDRHKEAVTEALKRGLLTERDLDEALRGLFRVSIRLGLWDPPDRVPYAAIGAEGDPEPWGRPETRALAREVTRKSIVLLKNSANLLPLDRSKLRSVAVVGPLANQVLLDWYSGTPPYAVSPREGLERAANPGPLPGPSSFGVNWVGDMSDAALELARRSDVVVVCVGNHPEGNAGWEVVTSPSEGKEAVDRKAITLPPGQEDFVRRLYAANPRTVVVLIVNFPVALPWAAANATTILHLTHASQELGNALADVLLGAANPGGHLAQTWPKSLEQLPPMMDYDLRHGRTYMYSKAEPQFPFGYGLSYTTFSYANLKTSRPTLAPGGSLDVSVNVTNTGSRAGDDVVQLYVRYPESKVDRPGKQLRGFRRITLAPGETKTVSLPLAAADLAYWDAPKHAWVVEPGRVELLVGRSSADADLALRSTVSVARR